MGGGGGDMSQEVEVMIRNFKVPSSVCICTFGGLAVEDLHADLAEGGCLKQKRV